MDFFGFGGSGKLIIDPVELSSKECKEKLKFEGAEIFLNKSIVMDQLKSTYISIFNSFLSKHHQSFLGKIYNLVDCPPGFEGALCEPCKFGFFKPFYGSRACVECPCSVDQTFEDGKHSTTTLNPRKH